jgi:uncharacterized protein YecE (DUF72 family)
MRRHDSKKPFFESREIGFNDTGCPARSSAHGWTGSPVNSRKTSAAIEIRNAGLVGPEYHKVLTAHGVAHLYNHWSYMSSLADQHQRMESFTAPFTVLRPLSPLKISYEAAKKRAEPYTKIVGELPEMRRDTVGLVRKAVGEGRRAYVLVNNRSEGNAPSTVEALTDQLRSAR